jgi:hypothetical protein
VPDDPWDERSPLDPDDVADPDLGPDPPEPEGSAGDAPALFWKLVVVFDVAFLALALGPMFIGFEGRWTFGGALTGFGALVFAYGVASYYRFRRRQDEDND